MSFATNVLKRIQDLERQKHELDEFLKDMPITSWGDLNISKERMIYRDRLLEFIPELMTDYKRVIEDNARLRMELYK